MEKLLLEWNLVYFITGSNTIPGSINIIFTPHHPKVSMETVDTTSGARELYVLLLDNIFQNDLSLEDLLLLKSLTT